MDDFDAIVGIADKRKPKIKRGTILAVHPSTVLVQPRGSTRVIECDYNSAQAVGVGKTCVYEFISKRYMLTSVANVPSTVDITRVTGSSQRQDHILHDNIGGEFLHPVEKTVLANNDILLLNDSDDGYRVKYVKVSNLPSGGGSKTALYVESVAAGTSTVTTPLTIFPGPGTGSLTLPSNWWTTGKIISAEFVLLLIGDVTPPSFTISVGFGGATADFTFLLPSVSFTGTAFVKVDLLTGNPGASASFTGRTVVQLKDGSSGVVTTFLGETSGVAEDSTTSLTFDILMSMSAGSPNEWDTSENYYANVYYTDAGT